MQIESRQNSLNRTNLFVVHFKRVRKMGFYPHSPNRMIRAYVAYAVVFAFALILNFQDECIAHGCGLKELACKNMLKTSNQTESFFTFCIFFSLLNSYCWIFPLHLA